MLFIINVIFCYFKILYSFSKLFTSNNIILIKGALKCSKIKNIYLNQIYLTYKNLLLTIELNEFFNMGENIVHGENANIINIKRFRFFPHSIEMNY